MLLHLEKKGGKYYIDTYVYVLQGPPGEIAFFSFRAWVYPVGVRTPIFGENHEYRPLEKTGIKPAHDLSLNGLQIK